MQNSRNITVHECNVSEHITLTNFFQSFKKACIDWLEEAEQKPIGGDGCTVEIDESLMSQRKYNHGRMLSAQWIFGYYCVETKEKFMVGIFSVRQVPDRTASTLLPIIENQISPNTKISSHSRRAYNNIDDLDINHQHSTVNHKENFVDPKTKTHTQHIERMWREVKRVNRRYEGINRNDIDTHLAKYQWRERNQVSLEN